MRKNYNKSNQEQKIKLEMKQRRVRVITLHEVFKKFTSQYWKNGNFDDTNNFMDKYHFRQLYTHQQLHI